MFRFLFYRLGFLICFRFVLYEFQRDSLKVERPFSIFQLIYLRQSGAEIKKILMSENVFFCDNFLKLMKKKVNGRKGRKEGGKRVRNEQFWKKKNRKR